LDKGDQHPVLTRNIQQNIQVWAGQFPPPEIVERYEALEAGTFSRLISMAERAQFAQIAAAEEGRRFQRDDTRRGHYLGFTLATISVVAGVICAYLKQPVVAGLCLGVPVLAVARSLIDSAGMAAARSSPTAPAPAPAPASGVHKTPSPATPSEDESKG
jgi:uncharacterized membrane protein